MDVEQISVKYFVNDPDGVDQDELIPVFHRWIREKRLGDVLLIDVADYRHVPDGPGVMLIAHEGHYGLDGDGGALGLQYDRKRDGLGPARPRLEYAFCQALTACVALEQEPALRGRITFDPGRVRVGVTSRRAAANTPEAYVTFQPLVADFLADLYGGADITFEHEDASTAEPLRVAATVASPGSLAEQLARIRQ